MGEREGGGETRRGYPAPSAEIVPLVFTVIWSAMRVTLLIESVPPFNTVMVVKLNVPFASEHA
jgi:hypothetical protein